MSKLILLNLSYKTGSKLRLSHELKIASHYKGTITVNIFDDNDENNDDGKEPINLIFCDISVEESDIDKIEDTLPIIAYLAGCCSHGAFKKAKCLHCRQKLIMDANSIPPSFKLIDVKYKGGLLYPIKTVFNSVTHTYIVVQKLISEKYENKFTEFPNQRNLIINLVENILISKDMFLSSDVCTNGHDILSLLGVILRSATNSLLNNYL
ncbi:uncharacterized protein LOC129988144 [Argiope bruennichi]|uniref:uncharacterized protein LOC129988144 n=1 Tax=Argiope bruennichi TaxID=94029 RepID=UPI0024951303|nr:uncharacterized protein LOC129988144 [Argiope bruennichi]